MHRSTLLVAFALAALPACSSESGSSAGSGGGAGAAGAAGSGGSPDAGTDAPSDAPSAECVALDQKLQAALDAARLATVSRDATMAITTPECGEHVYVSGDSGLTGQELFRIGSVTKTYVAALILELVGEGKLGLADTVDQWVAGVPNGATITVKMLLNHTSGVFNYTADPTFTSQPKKVWTPEELVALAASHGAAFAPGEKWSYSNTNYVLLGLIAEKVAGAELGAALRARFFTPEGLEHTFLDGAETVSGPMAPGFLKSGIDATYLVDPSGPWAAGAMVASPSDTSRWISELVAGDVLPQAMRDEMQTGVPMGPPNVSYGLGLMLLGPALTGGAGPGLGHGGDIVGYHTQAFHFPETKVTIVSIVNQDGAEPNDLTAAALTTLFP